MLLFFACAEPEAADSPAPEDSAPDTGDSLPDDSETYVYDSFVQPTWTILVYMDGDNDLEWYVPHDINELERGGGSGDGVEVLVQADRVEGYEDGDGDWTGTRRYRVVSDREEAIASEMLEDLGELDMGDPQTLADFLEWGANQAPADHYALILWDHGTAWEVAAPPPPGVASDDTSGSIISIANGDLRGALEPHAAEHGPLDLIGFDACSMASWEVAWDLREVASALVASSTSVGGDGFDYTRSLDWLRDHRDLGGADFGGDLAEGARDLGEYTQSVIDLGQSEALLDAVSALADAALADEAAMEALLAARDEAEGADPVWREYYLDLGDLARVAAASSALAGPAGEIVDVVAGAVPYNFTNEPFTWSTGMTIMADTREPDWLRIYELGSWAEASSWDELLWTIHDAEEAASVRQAAMRYSMPTSSRSKIRVVLAGMTPPPSSP